MRGTGWQKTWIRVLTTLLTGALMIMIFCFSTENAIQSDQRSGVISIAIIRIIQPEYQKMDAETQKTVYDEIQHAVRKSAHFTEYMMLGFMIRLCLESWFGSVSRRKCRLGMIGVGAGTAYACTDEAHQMWVEGRMGAWSDVLVDAGGVISGVILGTILIRYTERRSVSKQSQGV